ncbi:TPA: hypothetical protein DEG21_03195 [Patescibacteria group bacterium]|nr:hypothetical protein [Candidatus Gracilibacteria bacterium]HBY74865.1 hypothetical protein [Candidatus Gracilibacteria bacterium]
MYEQIPELLKKLRMNILIIHESKIIKNIIQKKLSRIDDLQFKSRIPQIKLYINLTLRLHIDLIKMICFSLNVKKVENEIEN